MYSIDSFTGDSLPDKSLCFTFDDGPGEHTYSIGKYLYEEGIRATFFVVGKYAFENPDILQSLKEFGHLIANHTYEHPELPYFLSENGNVQDQVIRTDLVIRNYLNGSTCYFRSPQGKWSKEVASHLNSNILTALNHVGPIGWDVGGVDCYYWQLNRSVDEAYSEYLKDITTKRKGIVVFHDDIADMDNVKPRNKTLQLLKLLVPKLKSEGYSFVNLEDIPSIKEAANTELIFGLKSTGSGYLFIKSGSNSGIYCSNASSLKDEFRLTELPYGKVAITASNGCFINVLDEGNEIVANENDLTSKCLFDLIPLKANKFILRAYNGRYLKIDNDKRLRAMAQYMRHAEIFSYYPKNLPVKVSRSFSDRLSLMKSRFLFVKSKILHA